MLATVAATRVSAVHWFLLVPAVVVVLAHVILPTETGGTEQRAMDRGGCSVRARQVLVSADGQRMCVSDLLAEGSVELLGRVLGSFWETVELVKDDSGASSLLCDLMNEWYE